MQFTITGRHQHLDEEVREYVRAKLEKVLHLSERLESAEIVVDVTKTGQRVEAVMHGPNGHRFVAHAEAHDLRTAVDVLEARLAAQVRAFKDRLTDHRP